MARIRASCPDCGDVELSPEQMSVRVAHGPAELVGDGSRYRFVCPYCSLTVHRPADERIVQLLLSGGVPVELGDLRALLDDTPPPHPERPPKGPRFGYDDLLDFHLLLQRSDWFDRVPPPR